MCGLIGAWDPAGLAYAPLTAALDDLRHRGPDAQNAVILEDGRLYLGHVRLKIIDVSDVANQPMVSPCGRYSLIFNGEIYNYRELRREIGSSWPWRTQGDSEVLLALYALYGEAMANRLNGMFAFCIYDCERHTLFLCRDRFGIKPLYYLRRGEALYFASEIPPLLRHVARVEPDLRTIRTYLETALYDFGEHTFFRDIKALEGGCRMTIDLVSGEVETRRWYRLADHVPNLSGIGEAELLNETERLLEQAIADQLVADVAVGLNVSGGVDSSLLVRIAVERLGQVHLFTQDYRGYSEELWVREISGGGTLHLRHLSGADIEAVLPRVVRAEGEPFGGVTVCGYDYLYRATDHERVTVLLDGNGVDECFLGYKKYHHMYVATCTDAKEQERLARDYQEFWGEACPMVRQSEGASIDGTRAVRPEALAPAFAEGVRPYEVPRLTDFADPVRNAAVRDLLYTKIPRGLRFNDRISMASSKELRVPYLDHRLVEFSLGIPLPLLLNKRGSKALFRQAAARRVPAGVAYAAKRSVQSPQREWLADEWRGMVMEVLDSASFRERGWIDPDAARRAYVQFVEQRSDNSFFIWQWLNLEWWARTFLD